MDSFRRTRSVQKMKAGGDTRQHPKKLLPVLVIENNVLPSIAPGCHVIERPVEFDAEWTSHSPSLAHQSYKKQDLTPPPSFFLKPAERMNQLVALKV